MDLKIQELQKTLFNFWRPHLDETEKITIDTTCYSEVRYLTDVKLFWE